MIESTTPAPPVGSSSLADFRDAHRGEAIVVCGCGESLNLLERPERFVTIGVNDVGRRFTPDYLVVVNSSAQFSNGRFRFVEISRAKVLFTHLSDLGVPHPNIVRFRLGRYGGTGEAGPGVLHYTRNSPYVAVCLAMHMGARRIGLIGVDFTEHHFFGATGPHPLAERLPQIQREYARLAESCRARGIELVNLSPTSRLTVLPRLGIDACAQGQSSASEPVDARRRVFFVNYRFSSCGDVFAQGLSRAAAALGVEHRAAWCDDPQLPMAVQPFAPDLVFVVHGRRFARRWADALTSWTRAVWLLDEPYEVDETSRWSSRFDLVFVNDPASMARHRHAHALPTAFDPDLHHDPGHTRDLDVGFIGGYNPVREQYLVRLADEGLLSYVVGGPWTSRALRALQIAERSNPADTARLYQRTRIVVNVFRSVHHFNREQIAGTALNPRVLEALACGALVVSEPRQALTETFPELPTFTNDAHLVSIVRELLHDPARAAGILAACRARLASHDYAHRLARVLDLAIGHRPSDAAPVADASPLIGWKTVGRAPFSAPGEGVILTADEATETGLVTCEQFRGVRLAFEVKLDATCRFGVRLHQRSSGAPAAGSYHVTAAPTDTTIARGRTILAHAAVTRGSWQRVEMTRDDNTVSVSIGEREVCRCADALREPGACAIGAIGGSAAVRALVVEALHGRDSAPVVPGWSVHGTGSVASTRDGLILSAATGGVTLVNETRVHGVELRFWVRLDTAADFAARIHQQSPDDPDADSYHLVSTPTRHYLARHDHVVATLRLSRRMWHRVVLRWVDEQLELFLDGRCAATVTDGRLPDGHSVIALASGVAEVRGLVQERRASS